MINDISGLKADTKLAEVIAESSLPCCLMHNRAEAVYGNYVEELLWDLEATLDIAHKAGVQDDKIILDPGVGFGKTYENNLEIIGQAGDAAFAWLSDSVRSQQKIGNRNRT